MAARQVIVPGAMPSRDGNGRSLPALLRFYTPSAAFSTPKTVYTTSALNVAHPFPLPSDSGGRFPQIWADEAEYFDVTWSRLDNDAFIAGFEDIRPLDDALLASADIATEAAAAAEDARDAAEEIAADLGDLQSAIAAAQTAETNAETAETNAETAETNAETALAGAVAAQAAAEAARDDAEEIVGFDPTGVVRVDIVQSHDAGEQEQARENIGAQPALAERVREKVARPAIAAGVLTLDCAAASIFEVSWATNITSVVLSGLVDDTDATTVTLILVAAGAASYSPGAAFKPFGTVAPTLSTTGGDRNFLTLTTRDGGDTVDQSYAGYTRP